MPHGLPGGMLKMNSLRPIIHAALPSLSFRSRALIDALFLTGGSLGPSHWVAKHLGLRNRLHVAAILEADGLPPLHRLRGWITVLRWVWTWEREGASLCRSALRAGKEPAACYRWSSESPARHGEGCAPGASTGSWRGFW